MLNPKLFPESIYGKDLGNEAAVGGVYIFNKWMGRLYYIFVW